MVNTARGIDLTATRDTSKPEHIGIRIDKKADHVEFTFPVGVLNGLVTNLHLNKLDLKFTLIGNKVFKKDWTFRIINRKVQVPYNKCGISRSKEPKTFVANANRYYVRKGGHVDEDITIPLREL